MYTMIGEDIQIQMYMIINEVPANEHKCYKVQKKERPKQMACKQTEPLKPYT